MSVPANGFAGLRVGYLVNHYPGISHTFIRREIHALERLGVVVERFSIRRPDRLVDEADVAEAARTRVVLDAGAGSILLAVTRTLLTRPLRFLRALRAVRALVRPSGRSWFVHLAYLAEACWLREAAAAAGVAHLHVHFGTNPCAVALLAKQLGGPTYSVTMHGPEEFEKAEALSIPTKVRESRFVLGISLYGKSQLARWTTFDLWPRIHVVRCGVDAAFAGRPPSPVPASRRLCAVARLSEQKGLPILIDACAVLRRAGVAFELRIGGDGPLRARLEERIAALDLGGCVKLLGWLSGSETRALMEESRALVLSSFAEGLPVVLMESMALGRPVVATRITGIPELVRDGENGFLVTAADVEGLAAAMQRVLDADPADLGAMGRKGRDAVLSMHDSDREAAVLASLLRDATETSSGDTR